jgi:four helix bundle protein
MAQRVEDLKLWQRADELWDAINALLGRPGLKRDLRLRNQLSDASDSIVSNIAEGFEQSSDRGFVRFLYIAKSSNGEARARLRQARKRGHSTETEWKRPAALSEEVARMITGLIKYLLKSNRKNQRLGRTDDSD